MKMHRFPKLFFPSSERRKSSKDSSSSRRPAKPKRLERSYALRNVSYEFSPSSSASSSSHSPEESQRGPSLDLYGRKTTSFRVDGTEGEFELICEAFGFSGIEDFAISPEEYEAMKVASSSSSSGMISKKLEPLYQEIEVDCDDSSEFRNGNGYFGAIDIDRKIEGLSSSGMISKKLEPLYQEIGADCDDTVEFRNGNGYFGAIDVINRKIEGLSVGNLGYSCGVASKKLGESSEFGYANRCREGLENGASFNAKLSVRSKVGRRNGIKGERPTIVVPTWDTSEGFLVDRDPCIPKVQSRFSSNKEETEVVCRDRSEQEKDIRVMAMIREENRALSESCSFSSNEDDSSSSMTEPMSSISSNERYGRVIHDWQKGELLGRGTFGSVYEGIADGGFFFAVKEVSLLDQEEEGKQCIIQLGQEIALLSQFEHENIVRYYGTEKDASHLYIFLELVSQGSLLRLYRKYDLRLPQVSGYTRQILHGLKYLHDRNVIHRDIKCANILVHTNGLVKLADFGLAKAAKLNDVKSCKGTAFWMAPEVVRSKGYGLAADIWSLGCTVLEMLTRRFPYFGLEHMSALYKIGKGERPDIPDTLSSDARDFIIQCLQVNPNLRPTAAQLLDHPFVKRPLPSSSGVGSAHSFGWQF